MCCRRPGWCCARWSRTGRSCGRRCSSTLTTTFEALLLAFFGGVGLAIVFNQSRLVEYSFYPYAVILQVTPVVAIAPLLLIYLPQQAAVLACAWIVAFFPVLANTTLGLNSVDRNLERIVPALRRVALADAARPETAGGAALHARRAEDRGRPVADRRGGGGNRRGFSRRRFGACLSHRRVRLSAQHPAHVRGAAAAVDRWRADLRVAVAGLASDPAALARQRGRTLKAAAVSPISRDRP